MLVNGTLVNYFFHCKRQCYLHGNRLNLEDNSEIVKIGKALHEERAASSENTEIAIDNIKLDKLTKEYLIEIKKSDADLNAGRWQLLFYLMILKQKGVIRKGRLEVIEKNKTKRKTEVVTLTEEIEIELNSYISDITKLINQSNVPEIEMKAACKKCAYYEYCYI